MKTLKSTLGLVIATGITVFTSSCEDLLNQVEMGIYSDYQEIVYELQPMPAGEYEIEKIIDAVNVDSISEAADTFGINSVVLSEAYLEIADNDGSKNFDAFESFEAVLISANMPEVTVGIISDVPDSATSLSFELINENLLNYMNSESYTLIIRSILDKDLEYPMTVVGKFRYKLGVGL